MHDSPDIHAAGGSPAISSPTIASGRALLAGALVVAPCAMLMWSAIRRPEPAPEPEEVDDGVVGFGVMPHEMV
jgi:hypothetical protein